jgi:hypothetical protein
MFEGGDLDGGLHVDMCQIQLCRILGHLHGKKQ